jgi:hypothetical protein
MRRAADERIQTILDQAKSPRWVLAWTAYGEKILAARELAESDLPFVESLFDGKEQRSDARDWFAFLGLVKEAA